jgi:hypothetical protein
LSLFLSNRVENVIKVTNRYELGNLAEFYILIWGTAPGGDEDIELSTGTIATFSRSDKVLESTIVGKV